MHPFSYYKSLFSYPYQGVNLLFSGGEPLKYFKEEVNIMKKILLVVMSIMLVLSFSLVSCNEKVEESGVEKAKEAAGYGEEKAKESGEEKVEESGEK
jgi:hypothetical protein